MKNIVWKIALIVAVILVCAYAVFPVEQKIRLGKDLRGGTSLIYLVKMPDNADKSAVLAQTIQVLKERVDPRGVLDISMAPLGADRIEIVMPLPNEEVQQLRLVYETELNKLMEMAEIRPSSLDESLRYNRAVEQFGGSSPERRGQIESLQRAYNDLQTARTALTEAQTSGVEGEALNKVEQAAADAEFNYETARDSVLRTSIDRGRITRTLGLPTTREPKRDPVTNQVERDADGNPVTGESQRDIALAGLKTDFPHLGDQIAATVAAFDAYHTKRTTLDDPEDLMRLLRGAGVLEYHIAVQQTNAEGVNIDDMRQQLREKGPEDTESSVASWYPINELKQWYDSPAELASLEADPQAFFSSRGGLVAERYAGQYYLLLYNSPNASMTHGTGTPWTVESSGITVDRLGRPAVSFRLDPAGGQLMSRLTGAHLQQPMAIVLDGQVYSAPNINGQIANSGVIEGDFSKAELNYLVRVLAAGALEARLSDQPIAINTLGPSLGKDNLVRGLEALFLSFFVTAAIMLGYYFMAGGVANIALLINVLIIFGFVGMQHAPLTLPGLAGLALSIAMAVDANVLIYERVREEIVNNKEDLRTAIRLGYSRALSAIVDGNVTNLIVCVVLYATATTEVKGFAFTMGWGVVATLFTALFITRVLFTIYTDGFKARKMPMLPTVIPGLTNALTPNVDWFSKRRIFQVVSVVAAILSIVLVFTRGKEMLDTEFRGGLALTMQTRLAQPNEPADAQGRLLLSRPDIEREIHEIGDAAEQSRSSAVHQLRNASVLTVGESKDFKASRFQIKVASPPELQSDETMTNDVVEALGQRFADRLDVAPSLSFKGEDSADHGPYTFPIQDPSLGTNINRPEFTQSVAEYEGGVAVVVDDIKPAITPEEARKRIERLRQQPDFASARDREFEVIGLNPIMPGDPSKGYASLAVVVHDDDFTTDTDFDQWDRNLAAREWKLISTAFAQRSTFQEVSSFSPAIARTLAANAVVAVAMCLLGMLVYIWVRFGSMRFSVATIVAVTLNVVICLGALALTHYLAGTSIAALLNLGEYRIDLNVIAALLTIIGYSLNDTIVILDRIRENRGKRLIVTPQIVNNSINQTFSRTVLTGGSTIIASIILFVLGGTGIQPFAFTFLIGLLVGTYSSVVIAAPLVIGGPPAAEPQSAASTAISRPRPTGTVAQPVS
jgi:SecD/SecF fusion protein